MSKRNVTYIKPEEPAFLKKIKEQVGYTEGPTVNTKRENLNPVEPEDLEDTPEEQPTVVVLQPGDLTAEEAAAVNKQREEAPADLTKPIVFRAKSKNKDEKGVDLSKSKNKRPLTAKETKSKKIKTSLLSFDQKEDDEEEEDN